VIFEDLNHLKISIFGFSAVFFPGKNCPFLEKKMEFFPNVNQLNFYFLLNFSKFLISKKWKKNKVFTVLPWVYMVIFLIFISYLIYSQIWLNLPMDDCHLGYSVKNSKKTSGLIYIANVFLPDSYLTNPLGGWFI
jgi:hypothetical protein